MIRKNLVTIFSALLVLSGVLASGLATAEGDPERGQKLYDQSCHGCHDTTIHTRDDRIIFSKRALHNRVAFCDAQAGSHWSADDINHVTEYLNDAYYKFDD